MTYSENSDQPLKCSLCGCLTTYMDKTKWGLRPHRRYDPSGMPICGRCYARALWKKKIPVGVSCDLCKTTEPTKTKYGTPKWTLFNLRDIWVGCKTRVISCKVRATIDCKVRDTFVNLADGNAPH